MNKNQTEYLQINYTSIFALSAKTNESVPIVNSWKFNSFTKEEMIIDLNFSNPVYVSSQQVKDYLDVKVMNTSIF